MGLVFLDICSVNGVRFLRDMVWNGFSLSRYGIVLYGIRDWVPERRNHATQLKNSRVMMNSLSTSCPHGWHAAPDNPWWFAWWSRAKENQTRKRLMRWFILLVAEKQGNKQGNKQLTTNDQPPAYIFTTSTSNHPRLTNTLILLQVSWNNWSDQRGHDHIIRFTSVAYVKYKRCLLPHVLQSSIRT